jgi:hypothetical protein
MPNLIIIDGGKGQLSFAIEELKKLEALDEGCGCNILALHEGIDKFFIPEACELLRGLLYWFETRNIYACPRAHDEYRTQGQRLQF